MKRPGFYEVAAGLIGAVLTVLVAGPVFAFIHRFAGEDGDTPIQIIWAILVTAVPSSLLVANRFRRAIASDGAKRVSLGTAAAGAYSNVLLFSALLPLGNVIVHLAAGESMNSSELIWMVKVTLWTTGCGLAIGLAIAPVLLPLGMAASWLLRRADVRDYRSLQRSVHA